MLVELTARRLVKPWGRRDLPAIYGCAPALEPLGEIWFERPQDGDHDALLVKYLFTSEPLSIQVHPADSSAPSGEPHGKDEAWLILEAARGARIGLGFRGKYSKDAIAQAAEDGSLEQLIDWRQAAPGDVYYSPAGTVHALGAGLTLIEIQQNFDLTYRLFDYGRDRELHLEAALAALDPESRPEPSFPEPISDRRCVLARGAKFTVEKLGAGLVGTLCASPDQPLWLVPLGAGVECGNMRLGVPSVWIAEGSVPLEIRAGGSLLVAYSGNAIRQILK
jgi:mannose-6-phosphate isomerase